MDKLDLILSRLESLDKEMKSLRFEMTDRFNDLKRTVQDQHLENIKADELILKTLMDHKSAVTDELVTYEHHFNIVDKEITALKIEMDRLKNKL